MTAPIRVFVVQRGTALYGRYEDKFISILGIFATLEDANHAVRLCQQEFMKEFGITDAADGEEFVGFCYEDHGGVEDDQVSPTGTRVGRYWEFDDGGGWYSCGVECFQVLGAVSAVAVR